jgi:S-layer protein (TIGR01567 family)
MKMATIIIVLGFVSFLIIIIPVFASDEVRSDIYDLNQKEVTLSGDTFSGFYYDIDDNTSAEKLTLRFSDISTDRASATLSDQEDAGGNRGVVYTTRAQPTDFDFAPWGQYEDIEFFSEDYLAAYDANVTSGMEDEHQSVPLLYDKSTDRNLMANEEISKILIDDDSKRVINSNEPLKLEEGYQLAIKAVDPSGKKVRVDLTKNGQFLDSKIIQPSAETEDIADGTYYFKTDLGKTKGVAIIAVHFKNVFVGNGTDNSGEVDGVFQISDEPIKLLADQVNPISLSIKMDNKNNKISFGKNKNIQIMKDIYIRTADQEVIDSQNPLRYYVYIVKPGYYMLHGSIANLRIKELNWTCADFPGFYYDIDDNIGTEKLTLRLSDFNSDSVTLSDQADVNGSRGIVYTTYAQPKNFRFKPWGQYKVVGFLGESYFAAYDDAVNQVMQSIDEKVAYLYDRSKNRNLMADEQISKILMDTDTEQTLTSNNSLKLRKGYELAIKSIDFNGDKAYLELSRNGKVVDNKVIQLSASSTKISDRTYYYKADIGDTKEIVQIAVHFKNVFAGNDIDIATVDGIFQLSETPTSIKAGQHFDMMSVNEVNPSTMAIKMDNKDNKIIIRKNKNILLMSDIYISVADQDDISAVNPLRYYIYKNVDIKEEALASKEQQTQRSEIKELNENVTEKSQAANETVATNSAETKNAGNITAKFDKAKENTTNYGAQNESKKQPDFGSVLAITSLLAVAYLTFTRKR